MITLLTLGQVTIEVGQETRRLGGDKLIALLVFLALHEGRGIRREYLAELLWSGVPQSRARHSLSQAIYGLRKQLPELTINADRDEISLPKGVVLVDVVRFRSAVQAQQYTEALSLYGGEFLAGFWIDGAPEFERWQLTVQQELSRLAKQVLYQLLRSAEQGGDWIRVTQLTSQLLHLDPYNEAALRTRIEAITATEGIDRALEEYQQVVDRIRQELRRSPEKATIELGELLANYRAVPEPLDVSLDNDHATPFIGRQHEFAQLRTNWERAKKGVGSAAVVIGEPGIGKSRLCDQFLRLCAVQGARIFLTQCHPTDAHIPYSAITRCVLENLKEDELKLVPASWVSVLSELMPELWSVAGTPKYGSPVEGEGARRRLFEAFVQLFQTIASGGPLVVHLDDFQWCDESTVALTHYLARRLHNSPVLILLSMRPVREIGNSSQQLVDGDGGARLYQQVWLEPLSFAETEEIIDAVADRHLVDLPEEVRHSIFTQVGGRPFFIIELVRAISKCEITWVQFEEQFRVGATASLLPTTIEEFLLDCMHGLSDDAEPVIATLAVVGTRADLELIAHVGGLPPQRLIRGLEELVDRGLVQETDRDIAFSHDLIREAAYRSVGRSRRRLLHKATADFLKNRKDTPNALLCTHYDMAGVKNRAYQYAMLAAEDSRRVYGHRETEYFLRVALANAEDITTRSRALEKLAELVLDLSRYPEAESLYRELLTLDPIADNSQTRLNVECKLLRIAIKQSSEPPEELTSRINDLIATARRLAEYEVQVELLTSLINIGHMTGGRDLVLNALSDLSELVGKIDNLASEAVALTYLANVGAVYKGASKALAYAEQAVKRAIASEDSVAYILALCSRALSYLQTGLLSAAEADLEQAFELISRFAAKSHQLFTMNIHGVALLERGDFDKARQVFNETIGMAIDSEALSDQLLATGNLLLVEHESGNHEAAAALAHEVISLSDRAPYLWCTIGAWSILGIYALERGDLDQAVGYRRAIMAHAGGRDFWVSDASYTEIFFVRLTTMEGDPAGALDRLDRAIAAYSDRDFFCRCRLQIERARLLLETDPVEAGRQAAEVRSLAKGAGARPLVAKADAILDRLPDPAGR